MFAKGSPTWERRPLGAEAAHTDRGVAGTAYEVACCAARAAAKWAMRLWSSA